MINLIGLALGILIAIPLSYFLFATKTGRKIYKTIDYQSATIGKIVEKCYPGGKWKVSEDLLTYKTISDEGEILITFEVGEEQFVLNNFYVNGKDLGIAYITNLIDTYETLKASGSLR